MKPLILVMSLFLLSCTGIRYEYQNRNNGSIEMTTYKTYPLFYDDEEKVKITISKSTGGQIEKISWHGRELIAASSSGSSNPAKVPVAAATCPPAEPPPAAKRSGSTPNSSACRRIQRIADLPSFTHSAGEVPSRLLTRYSAAIATMPRDARYSQ